MISLTMECKTIFLGAPINCLLACHILLKSSIATNISILMPLGMRTYLGGDLLLTIRPLTMVSKMICYKTMSSKDGRQQLVLHTFIHGKLVFVHIFHDVTTIQEDWVDIIELFSATSLVCLCFFYCHVWYRKLIAFIWQDQCSLLFYLFPRQHYFSSFSLLLDLIHSIAIVVPFKNTAQQMLGMSSFLWS